jgi:hypothetical protein
MGVDIRQLSPAAQRQVLQKLSAKTAKSANKYGNQKVEVNGILFDSKREARRYLELATLEKAREIQNLRRQVKYLLIPSQRIDGKVVEREVTYVADFVYEQNGETVVEDSKGHRTKDYILKRKMLLYFHGIRIREV